jgi:hypothetical protein
MASHPLSWRVRYYAHVAQSTRRSMRTTFASCFGWRALSGVSDAHALPGQKAWVGIPSCAPWAAFGEDLALSVLRRKCRHWLILSTGRRKAGLPSLCPSVCLRRSVFERSRWRADRLGIIERDSMQSPCWLSRLVGVGDAASGGLLPLSLLLRWHPACGGNDTQRLAPPERGTTRRVFMFMP